jgi:hypothetical protein
MPPWIDILTRGCRQGLETAVPGRGMRAASTMPETLRPLLLLW